MLAHKSNEFNSKSAALVFKYVQWKRKKVFTNISTSSFSHSGVFVFVVVLFSDN